MEADPDNNQRIGNITNIANKLLNMQLYSTASIFICLISIN